MSWALAGYVLDNMSGTVGAVIVSASVIAFALVYAP